MSDYRHDIFLSYRRTHENWVRWADKIVVDALVTLLGPAIGDARIFHDTTIETGAPWPRHLADAHARSKILVALLSRDYFTSVWCRLELALMYERQKQCERRAPAHQAVLIIPFVIDDGTCFPPEVQRMQLKDIHKYANPYLQRETKKHFKFTEVLRGECPRIESAVKGAPPFEPAWETLARDQFEELFKIQLEKQTTLPGLSLLHENPPSDR